MKIIEPSAQIIEDELSQLSIYQRIAYCAGVCYQREPNKTEEEAQAFCKKMVSIGHLSTLEMAVVHLVCSSWNIPQNDFIKFECLDAELYIVRASIRALLESEMVPAMQSFLHSQYPVFFGDAHVMSASDISDKGRIRLAQQHEIPWQHQHVAVRFIVNRAVSHELVRHRPMSFLQESQRYCRYEDDVVFIRPEWFTDDDWYAPTIWSIGMEDSENRYQLLLRRGLKPQQARAVLPNSTKTELIAYAPLPQWKHIFNLRCSSAADPEMRRVMIPLEQEFKAKYPEAFNEQDH